MSIGYGNDRFYECGIFPAYEPPGVRPYTPRMSAADEPEHVRRPHARPFQPIPVMKEKQPFCGLRDPLNLAGKMLMIPAPIVGVLGLFQGEHDIREIAQKVGAPEEPILELAKQLEAVGLLWGPTSERMERELSERLRGRGQYEVGAATAFGETADDVRQTLDKLLAQAEDPELESPVRALIAPHLDAARGGPNYGAAYRALAGSTAFDRVVVLGTNHFGMGDGVVGARLGFDTPLGPVACDAAFAKSMEGLLGDRLYKDELDHVGEHSIQLHMPWVAHLLPGVPVWAALVPSPLQRMLSDDGARASHAEFCEALPKALEGATGRTLLVVSADLSHVGPQFGDQTAVDDDRLKEIESHDRAMLGSYEAGNPDDFVVAMAEHENATRWCSIGSMSAALHVLGGASVELLQYRQSIDERRSCLVTSAAMAICGAP